MKKNISMLIIMMSVFCVLNSILLGYQDVDIIIRITCIIGISILELLDHFLKINEKKINFLQIISILVFESLGFNEIIFLLPIVIFKIIKNKASMLTSILISLCIASYFYRENFLYMCIYIIIANLYLYELKKQRENELEIKEFNRGQRYESHLMEHKVRNLERYIEQNNVVISLKERNFMAQKLHDHLGHRITSSLMQLEVTKEALGKNNELANKYLLTAMENLREGMDEIRHILRNVKPRDRVIGVENVKEQLLKFEYSTGIKTTLNIEGNINKITLRLWMVLEENINEALTNAAKYSMASVINLSIFVYNKITRIEFRDNGNGYKNLNKGLGLRGIEERVQGLGGRVEYCNDNGFIINMIFNLEELK
ncbi:MULTISPECIES: histidine kinase [unclassified Clostridium]|uniref:sensor histidine kinase n=1 Tax=unclassified Clostridium TaxID=2614128 RepID=UPI00029757F0|nr:MULTISPECIES: histidine kinase [unclassified Clostridium]EKQ50884.1 MAG: signal transduction histidine kinase [Clostridium sp. Maddingley MBC34-26]